MEKVRDTMAKLETTINGNFSEILRKIENGILGGSISASLEDSSDGKVYLSAITSGGSQAVFFKINTFGEEAFLDKLREIL